MEKTDHKRERPAERQKEGPAVPAFETMGIHVPELLLPKDPNSPVWPCVACDQYTSQPEVWREMERWWAKSPPPCA